MRGRDDLLTQKHKEKGKDTGQPGDRKRREIEEARESEQCPVKKLREEFLEGRHALSLFSSADPHS